MNNAGAKVFDCEFIVAGVISTINSITKNPILTLRGKDFDIKKEIIKLEKI